MKKTAILLSAIIIAVVIALGSVCAFAATTDPYVYDYADLFSGSESDNLQIKAQNIVDKYHCEIYIVTVSDMAALGYNDAYDLAVDVYKTNDLGYGSGRDGMILLISMADRDFGLATYGDYAKAVFNNPALDRLEDAFLDNFRNNDWYGGFRDYLNAAEKELYSYMNPPSAFELIAQAFSEYGIFAGLAAIVVAGGRVGVMSAKMKSVKTARSAGNYVEGRGLVLKGSRDVYTHTTTTRVRIQSSSSSGGSHGSHRSGGGFSGRSGKF